MKKCLPVIHEGKHEDGSNNNYSINNINGFNATPKNDYKSEIKINNNINNNNNNINYNNNINIQNNNINNKFTKLIDLTCNNIRGELVNLLRWIGCNPDKLFYHSSQNDPPNGEWKCECSVNFGNNEIKSIGFNQKKKIAVAISSKGLITKILQQKLNNKLNIQLKTSNGIQYFNANNPKINVNSHKNKRKDTIKNNRDINGIHKHERKRYNRNHSNDTHTNQILKDQLELLKMQFDNFKQIQQIQTNKIIQREIERHLHGNNERNGDNNNSNNSNNNNSTHNNRIHSNNNNNNHCCYYSYPHHMPGPPPPVPGYYNYIPGYHHPFYHQINQGNFPGSSPNHRDTPMGNDVSEHEMNLIYMSKNDQNKLNQNNNNNININNQKNNNIPMIEETEHLNNIHDDDIGSESKDDIEIIQDNNNNNNNDNDNDNDNSVHNILDINSDIINSNNNIESSDDEHKSMMMPSINNDINKFEEIKFNNDINSKKNISNKNGEKLEINTILVPPQRLLVLIPSDHEYKIIHSLLENNNDVELFPFSKILNIIGIVCPGFGTGNKQYHESNDILESESNNNENNNDNNNDSNNNNIPPGEQNRIIILHCGYGLVNISLSVATVVQTCNVDAILLLGSAISLHKSVKPGNLIIPTKIVHNDIYYNTSIKLANWLKKFIGEGQENEFNAPIITSKGILFSSDKIIYSEQKREELSKNINYNNDTNNNDCNMDVIGMDRESAAVAQISKRLNIPFVVIKTIGTPNNNNNYNDDHLFNFNASTPLMKCVLDQYTSIT